MDFRFRQSSKFSETRSLIRKKKSKVLYMYVCMYVCIQTASRRSSSALATRCRIRNMKVPVVMTSRNPTRYQSRSRYISSACTSDRQSQIKYIDVNLIKITSCARGDTICPRPSNIMRAIPERLRDASCGDAIQIDYLYILFYLQQ